MRKYFFFIKNTQLIKKINIICTNEHNNILNNKKEWDVLFNNQIIFGDYYKTPFLVRSAALFSEIMPRASIRQGLVF